jgi:hypothetical protein
MATRTLNARPGKRTGARTLPPGNARAVASITAKADEPALIERLRVLLPAIVVATVVVEATVLYRLWAQMTASVPSGAPASWVYGLGGSLVEPFRRYDTSVPVREAPILDLAALIALEAYLTVGVVAGLLVLFLSHAPFFARIAPWHWHLNLAPVGHALAGALSTARGAASHGFTAGRRVWVSADYALKALTLGCIAYLRNRDWAGYRDRAAAGLNRASTLTREQAHSLAAKPDWQTYKSRATTYTAHANERLQHVSSTAASRSRELIASRDWSRDRQRVIAAREAAIESSRGMAQRIDASYHRGAQDVRRLASYTSPRARSLLIDTGRALYVRGPQSAGWLSSQLGARGRRGSASLVSLLSARPAGNPTQGETLSRRDFLRLAMHRAEQR